MRVAIIDVGSNTARLLVANVTGKGAVVPVAEEREYLRLGAEIERTGTLSAKKIAAAADTCSAYARRIAELGVERATVIVTAPGRQGAAAPELTAALADATSLPVRVLTAESEGRLAYDGAVARAGRRSARGRRRRRRRRWLDRGRRRHAAPRRRLGPVGRRRLAPPHARPPHRRSALGRADPGRGRRRRPRARGHEPAAAGARARSRRQRPRADEDRRPPLRRGRSRAGRQDPLPPPGREGGAPVRHRARARRDPARRRAAPRRRVRVLGTAFELGNGGLREGAALELAGARDAVRAA